MARAMTVRFSETRTKFGSTNQAIQKIADYLGVSQNKAIHLAINRLYDQCFPDEISPEYPTFRQRKSAEDFFPFKDQQPTSVTDSILSRIR